MEREIPDEMLFYRQQKSAQKDVKNILLYPLQCCYQEIIIAYKTSYTLCIPTKGIFFWSINDRNTAARQDSYTGFHGNGVGKVTELG